jgi:hypothetical protein
LRSRNTLRSRTLWVVAILVVRALRLGFQGDAALERRGEVPQGSTLPVDRGLEEASSLPSPERRVWHVRQLIVITAAVGLAAAALRLFRIRSSYELFIDEAIYARISHHVATRADVSFSQIHFYLHPPLYFLIQGGLERAFPLGTANPIEIIDRARLLNVGFAAANAVLITIIVARVAGPVFAAIAGFAYSFDPFLIRFDSRVLLETSAVFWVLVAVALLVTSPRGQQIRAGRLVAVGVACGLSLLSKETAAPLYMVFLGLSVLRDAPLRRRSALLALGAMAATYAPYPITAFAIGDGHTFVEQKFSGVLRMIGVQQETGFNAPGAPTFVSRLVADLTVFAPSYVVILLGFCALPILLRSSFFEERLIGTVVLGGFALLTYQIGIGTLEEQMFYFLVVPSLLAVASVRRPLQARVSARGRRVLVAGTSLLLAGSGALWWHVHTVPDDGLRQSLRWVSRAAGKGGVIAPLVDTSQLLLPRHPLVVDGDFATLRRKHVTWVLTSSLQVEQGYGLARPKLIEQLRRHAVVAYQTKDRSSGTIIVWRMSPAKPRP